DVAGHKYSFSVSEDAEACLDARTNELVVLGAPLLQRRDLPLLGQHNVGNALAASVAVMAADRSHQTQKARKGIAAALRTFRSLPHRLELVGEFGGVQWINDSKATNVSSAAVAIDGMERPTVLLLGGRHKGEAYTALSDVVRRKVKRVIAYGEAAPIIATDLRPVVDVVRLGSDFDEVIQAARATARPGDGHADVLVRQLLGMAVGVGLFAVSAKLDAEMWEKWAWPTMILSVVLLIIVILPFTAGIAPRVHGSRRYLFGSSLQPSELAKLAVIVWTSMLVIKKGGSLRRLTKGLLPFLLVIGALNILVMLEPDLSTAMMFTLVMGIILFAAGVRIGHFVALG